MNKRETISYFDFDLSQATCHIEQHQCRSPVCNQKQNLGHATKNWFRGSDQVDNVAPEEINTNWTD